MFSEFFFLDKRSFDKFSCLFEGADAGWMFSAAFITLSNARSTGSFIFKVFLDIKTLYSNFGPVTI